MVEPSANLAYICIDNSQKIVYAHSHAELFGPDFNIRSRGQLLFNVFTGSVRDDVMRLHEAAAKHDTPIEAISTWNGQTYRVTVTRNPQAMLFFWRQAQADSGSETVRKIVSDFGARLASSLDYEATLSTVVRAGLATLGDFAILDIMVLDNVLRRVAWAHVDPEQEKHFDSILNRGTEHYFDQNPAYNQLKAGELSCVQNADESWIESVAGDENHAEFLRDLDFKSIIIIPLIARGRTVAVLNFCFRQANQYSEQLLQLANDFGRMSALAVDNALLYGAAQDEIERRQDAEKVLDGALRRLGTHIQNTAMAVIEWSHDFRVLTWSPQASNVFGWTESEVLGKRPSEWPYMDNEDSESVQWAVGRVLTREDSYGSAISRIKNKWGSELQCEWHTSATTNDNGEVLLVSFVQDVSERIRIETALQVRLNEESLLNRINMAILSSDDGVEIERAAIMALSEVLHPDRCFFVKFDLRERLAVIEDEWRRVDLEPIRGSHNLAALGINPVEFHVNQETVNITDIESGGFPETALKFMNAIGVRSVLSVPIFGRAGLTATLTLAMDQPRIWEGRELSMVEGVAATVRTAVESATLRRREHNIATTLQAALQPTEPDAIPGVDIGTFYRPALDEANIGGDFYDVFEIVTGKYAVVIGDVSGKGLSAAAQVSMIRNLLRCLLYQNGPPATTATELNKMITDRKLMTGFVTLAVCIYEVDNRKLSFVSCGHETLLIRRSGSSDIEALTPTGPPIGIMSDYVYEQVDTVMAAGDMLLLYTDGLTEAGLDHRNMLGVSGVADTVPRGDQSASAQQVALEMIAKVEAFAGGTLADDACLIVALFKDNA